MNLYSLKMRGSSFEDGEEKHISGAERIVKEGCLTTHSEALLKRALYHSKGKADLINIKIERVKEEEFLHLEALKVSTIEVDKVQDGIQKMIYILKEIGISNWKGVLEKMQETYNMRGAMLLDVDTLERLEPDKQRGIRATYMDDISSTSMKDMETKNHYKEAIILATKVAYGPNIIGEICISDDPNYITGYIASKNIGYVRITKLKELGSEFGGRIFLYRGDKSQVQKCIDYIEKQKVLVMGVPSLEEKFSIKEENKFDFMEKELMALKDKHLYRTMKEIETAQSSHIMLNGKQMIMMASNSYLDMSNNPIVKDHVMKAIEKYGIGSGGSRLTTGTTTLHKDLESNLANFKGTEAALVYSSGYMANVGVISSICSKEDIIFSDELNHASIIDGCALSKSKVIVYSHNDMEDLEKKIKENPCKKGLIVSDAVFSMDGDIVNLPKLMEIADKYGLISMIDEAHSTGVLGKTGRGIVEHFNMTKKPDIIMGTLSKAIGSEGGFICGKQIVIEYLKNKSRSFIFSTSLSPATIAASIKSIELIMKEPERVQLLQENIRYFCQCLKEAGLEVDSKTPIIPIIIGDEEIAMKISEELFSLGYYISAIRYPTVKKGKARLRIALMATHTKEELKSTAKAIGLIVKKYKLQ